MLMDRQWFGHIKRMDIFRLVPAIALATSVMGTPRKPEEKMDKQC